MKPTRNKKLLRRVADAIKRHPEQYDQELFYQPTDCGSAACIAGWAIALDRGWTLARCVIWSQRYHPLVSEKARRSLGLTWDESFNLFAPDWQPRAGLTVPQALREIAKGASIESVSCRFDDRHVFPR